MIEGNCRQVSAVPFFNDSMGQWGCAGTAPPVADEACPPQGSGPIFTARRVWKSVCRNESTSFPGTFPVVAPSSGGCAATFPPRGRLVGDLFSSVVHPALAVVDVLVLAHPFVGRDLCVPPVAALRQ